MLLMQKYLDSTEETEAFGAELFKSLPSKCVVFLYGDLGAGKQQWLEVFFEPQGITARSKAQPIR